LTVFLAKKNRVIDGSGRSVWRGFEVTTKNLLKEQWPSGRQVPKKIVNSCIWTVPWWTECFSNTVSRAFPGREAYFDWEEMLCRFCTEQPSDATVKSLKKYSLRASY